ncbi:1,4-alpha-glucan branching protein GlgB [Clostridium sp. SM-530-WT-3G]|uniref:1,4-alpha-glucan branching protein GlgB n=1 Tax=Clostridium sp. SM-530-WT-3G TaxID=2725303 RepID=UPI00145FB856|nr:1,4-alpha-glucan branching protein GlgB [Clostridium sp. SM-530-WT-3G]NME82501.1 1,4-alpha-glucan branching protein GlgB [Clostridium sp. SM-530-WT-3G]
MIDENKIQNYLNGNSLDSYYTFGAHFTNEYNQYGVRFTVYAPNAEKVMLVGSFNDWEGYDMHKLSSGVWTIFAKDIPELSLYKYRIITKDNEIIDKIDPFAFYSELRPNTASKVYNIDNFPWSDYQWMKERTKNFNSPMNIYEIHLGSWKKKNDSSKEDTTFYSYNELSEMIIPYVKEMGYTHIELLPITEYPYDGSWGYQSSGYFSPTSRYGTPKEFMNFINTCHNNNIGVIMDIVPGHHVKDGASLYKYDGSYVYENDDESLRFTEWDTALFDFSKPHVVSYIKSSLDFWLTYYHIDGLRYDAVSTLIYHGGDANKGINEPALWFLRNTNYALQNKHKTAMLIAEDSSTYVKVTAPVIYGGVGFDYKWNFGWMHDTLEYFSLSPADRENSRYKITFSFDYFYNEIFLLPISHDEVSHFKCSVINRMYGTYDEKFDNLKCFYLFMITHPGKKLNFMGNELGQFDVWNDHDELDWNLLEYQKHKYFCDYIKELHSIYLSESSLFQNDYNALSFKWVQVDEYNNCIFSYYRNDLNGNLLYVIINLSNHSFDKINMRVDYPGKYIEILNTDDSKFDGSGNTNSILTAGIDSYGHYLNFSISPLSGIIFKYLK